MHKDEEIRVPIYNYKIRLVLTDDIVKYCKENQEEDLLSCPLANVYDFYGKEYPVDFVSVFRIDELSEDIIVHETFHITARIMRYVGTPLVQETEEPYAYLQDTIYRTFRNKLAKMKIELNDEISKQNELTVK